MFSRRDRRLAFARLGALRARLILRCLAVLFPYDVAR